MQIYRGTCGTALPNVVHTIRFGVHPFFVTIHVTGHVPYVTG